MQDIKNQFPIFQRLPELVYLDNAATTQKPQSVLDAIIDFYTLHNSNVHRGLYPLSEEATDMFEDARSKIARYINADPEEIFFVANATDGLNSLSRMLVEAKLVDKDSTVAISELEHHSNSLPWTRISEKLKFIDLEDNSVNLMKDETIDLLAITHASNVTGSLIDLRDLRRNYPESLIVVDASQSIAHTAIDVKASDVDFLVFSGHKAYGPMGIGVVYGKRSLLEKLNPDKLGGGIIREVKRENPELNQSNIAIDFKDSSAKFESGTPSVADAIGLASAIDFLETIGIADIQAHEEGLRYLLVQELEKIEGVQIFHPKDHRAVGVVSFIIDGVHPHDLAEYLGESQICLRAGHHCTQILHKEVLQIPASLRASIGIYNTEEDISKLLATLKAGITFYKK